MVVASIDQSTSADKTIGCRQFWEEKNHDLSFYFHVFHFSIQPLQNQKRKKKRAVGAIDLFATTITATITTTTTTVTALTTTSTTPLIRSTSPTTTTTVFKTCLQFFLFFSFSNSFYQISLVWGAWQYGRPFFRSLSNSSFFSLSAVKSSGILGKMNSEVVGQVKTNNLKAIFSSSFFFSSLFIVIL